MIHTSAREDELQVIDNTINQPVDGIVKGGGSIF